MPWVTVAGGDKLCVYASPATGHDAVNDSPPLYADMTRPPDVALRERLTPATPETIRRLLFVPLTELNIAPSSSTAPMPSLVASALDAVGTLSEWMPFDDGDFGRCASLARYSVYVALVVRVNALEKYCKTLRIHQTTSTTASDDSLIDALSYYMHAWLDAHLLAALAVERAAAPPVNGSEFMAALLDAYSPSMLTVFHEGELPALIDVVESCSFFSDMAPKSPDSADDADDAKDEDSITDDLTAMLNKTVPRRCGVRGVITHIEQACIKNAGVMYLLESLVAASLLGIYRHARERPALAERLRLYRVFFYVPPSELATLLERQRSMRGLRNVGDDEHFSLPASAVDDVVVGSYASACRRAGLPSTPEVSGISHDDWRRRELVYGFIAARVVKAAPPPAKKKKPVSQQQSYIYQNTIVNIVREYVILVLNRFLPHVFKELCSRTQWADWQTKVIVCMDTMRAAPPSPESVLRCVSSSSLPPKTLYQVELMSFTEAVVAACVSFLDTGIHSEQADGSERPLDAVVTPELEHVLRRLIARYPRSASGLNLLPVMAAPESDEEFERDYAAKGVVPFALFYASAATVREYRACAAIYARMPSPAVTTGLVRFLVNSCGMYQFMLVHAFAQAQLDCSRVYAFPLAEHLARQQAAVLRERLNVSEEEPLPIHLLTSFVCLQCREFRGALIPASAKPTNELPMSGSELVSFQTTCIEARVANTLRAQGFPSFETLVNEARCSGGTLFEYYRTHATIDSSTAIYPDDPSAFDALPTATATAQAWLRRVHEDAPECFDFDPSILLVDDVDIDERLPVVPLAAHMIESPLGEYAAYEEFLRRWEERNGRPFLCGHRSSDERKCRQTGAAMQKVANSITEQERESALRSANQRRRHDVRCYYRYSKCSRSRLLAVSMLGYGLRVDDAIIVACCLCLGYTRLDAAHWYNDTLACTRCYRRAAEGVSLSLGTFGASATAKCRGCSAVRKPGDKFTSTPAYDETAREFVTIYLCERHSKKKAWLFAAPNYHSLATIDAGIKANWGALRSWDAAHDYTASLFADADAEDVDEVAKLAVNMARACIGAEALDDDADDEDADEEEEDKKKKPVAAAVEPQRRRRVAADRRKGALVK